MFTIFLQSNRSVKIVFLGFALNAKPRYGYKLRKLNKLKRQTSSSWVNLKTPTCIVHWSPLYLINAILCPTFPILALNQCLSSSSQLHLLSLLFSLLLLLLLLLFCALSLLPCVFQNIISLFFFFFAFSSSDNLLVHNVSLSLYPTIYNIHVLDRYPSAACTCPSKAHIFYLNQPTIGLV